MSTEHLLHTDANFAISVDERGSRFNLFVRSVPGMLLVETDYDSPHSEGAYLDTEFSAMDLAILAIRALQAASYHTNEAEEEGIRHALLAALPGWVR